MDAKQRQAARREAFDRGNFYCCACFEELPQTEFTREKSNRWGLSYRCRMCQRAWSLSYLLEVRRKEAFEERGRLVCSSCETEKALVEFRIARRWKYGRDYICKDCRKARHIKPKTQMRRLRHLQSRTQGKRFCPRCETSYTPDCFYRSRYSPDGLASYCKTCHVAGKRAARRKNWTPERIANADRRWALRPKGLKECRMCNCVLPEAAFGKANNKVRSQCKGCRRETPHKYCVSCGLVRPKSDFLVQKGTPDGVSAECKPCFEPRAKFKQEDKRRERVRMEKYMSAGGGAM